MQKERQAGWTDSGRQERLPSRFVRESGLQLIPRPVIYEINTWVWLNELSRHFQRAITLGSVPAEQWDAIASLGVDAVWLMGVWERSPEGIRIANENADLQADFRRVLLDYTSADNIGSAYCVHRYV